MFYYIFYSFKYAQEQSRSTNVGGTLLNSCHHLLPRKQYSAVPKERAKGLRRLQFYLTEIDTKQVFFILRLVV